MTDNIVRTPADPAPETLPRTMSAWVQTQYGGPETVHQSTIDVPTPGKGEVLLRVRATGLNAADVRLMRGEPLLLRAFFGLRRPRNTVRGMDIAGTVVAVGDEVTEFAVGDEVVGELPGGGLAEFAVAPVRLLTSRPETVPAVEAAALPMAAGTAWQGLDLAKVASGHRVLVVGAGGGVGTFTVQIAAARGAEVWALTGQRTRPLIADLGAVRTFDYTATDAAALPAASFDAVIDIAGTASLRVLQRLLRDGGVLVMVAGDGGRILGPMGRIARAALLGIGSKRAIKPLAASAKPTITAQLLELTAAGRIRPVIERTWSLETARDALAHVDTSHAVGKNVITPA